VLKDDLVDVNKFMRKILPLSFIKRLFRTAKIDCIESRTFIIDIKIENKEINDVVQTVTETKVSQHNSTHSVKIFRSLIKVDNPVLG
jgi:hypothetical protein